jgi:hypothetical protein
MLLSSITTVRYDGIAPQKPSTGKDLNIYNLTMVVCVTSIMIDNWRERLRSHVGFLKFLGNANAIFAKAEDPESVAEALRDGEYKTAQELSGLSEEEFVSALEDLNSRSEELMEDEKVRSAIDEFGNEQTANG